jgi:type I restriction enzyme S subunit
LGANSARVLNPGAVLTVCIGATLGKVGWIDRNCATNQQINAIQPDSKLIDSEFLSYLLASPSLQAKLWAQASSTTLPILNKGRFEKIVVRLPRRAEQLKLVEAIREWESAVTRLKAELANGMHRADRLRRSLLEEAFAGELVQQDCADEPASVLLDRIRVERVAQPMAGRGRSRAKPSRQKEMLL